MCLLPTAGVSFNITPGVMFFMDLNMAERKGRQIWEEYLYRKRLEICVETIFPYPSAQTISALCDQAAPQCEF
jgi:hypothetical protein